MTGFQIGLYPELLSEGPPEERASAGFLVFKADGVLLSEGYDNLAGTRRDGPFVSGYHLAEWLLWNWWRIRHEPSPYGSNKGDWLSAHCLSEIGEGYDWPQITISSDGYRSAILSEATSYEGSTIRYYGTPSSVALPWTSVERGIDEFVQVVRENSTANGILKTNLDAIWTDLMGERQDSDLGRIRRLEALLGAEPDELPNESVEARIADAIQLGDEAVDELAAAAPRTEINKMMTAAHVSQISERRGMEYHSTGTLAPDGMDRISPSEDRSAAEIGVLAARHARRLANLKDGKVDNRSLAELAGVSQKMLDPSDIGIQISFVHHSNGDKGRMVLRGARRENLRFELARLAGDMLIWGASRVRVSTDSNTYRQKSQRAFAMEFLAPKDQVASQAEGDFSIDRMEKIARHFEVSPIAIKMQLSNNGTGDMTDRNFTDAA